MPTQQFFSYIMVIGICCFSAKYVVRANTGWLGIGDNAPEWSDMSTCGLVVSMS
jgi:hypothetical protein